MSARGICSPSQTFLFHHFGPVELSTLNTKHWERKRHHLSDVVGEQGKKRLPEHPVSPLSQSPPLGPRQETPVVPLLSLGMNTILPGFFALFFSNISLKISWSGWRICQTCIIIVANFLRLARIPLFWETVVNQETDLPSSQYYLCSALWNSHGRLLDSENMASTATSFVFAIKILELSESCFGILP